MRIMRTFVGKVKVGRKPTKTCFVLFFFFLGGEGEGNDQCK